jgi:hypothetical protein
MKAKFFFPSVLALTLALPAMAEIPLKLLGDPAPPTAAERVITITPGTRYVRVEGGEVIKFDVGGQTFGWNFDTGDTVMAFDLNRIAPQGLLNQKITVIVEPNPLYSGG